jgi:hypothetical protein
VAAVVVATAVPVELVVLELLPEHQVVELVQKAH